MHKPGIKRHLSTSWRKNAHFVPAAQKNPRPRATTSHDSQVIDKHGKNHVIHCFWPDLLLPLPLKDKKFHCKASFPRVESGGRLPPKTLPAAFCYGFDSSQARQTVRWRRFRGLEFALKKRAAHRVEWQPITPLSFPEGFATRPKEAADFAARFGMARAPDLPRPFERLFIGRLCR